MLLPMLFDPQYLAMKQIVDSGEIGEVAPRMAEAHADLRHTILWIGIHMID